MGPADLADALGVALDGHCVRHHIVQILVHERVDAATGLPHGAAQDLPVEVAGDANDDTAERHPSTDRSWPQSYCYSTFRRSAGVQGPSVVVEMPRAGIP
jgi:hypothetical protein